MRTHISNIPITILVTKTVSKLAIGSSNGKVVKLLREAGCCRCLIQIIKSNCKELEKFNDDYVIQYSNISSGMSNNDVQNSNGNNYAFNNGQSKNDDILLLLMLIDVLQCVCDMIDSDSKDVPASLLYKCRLVFYCYWQYI